MADCLFCRIVSKKIPADVVAESPKALAFRDINPQAPVHVLVIPKEHIAGVLDLDKGRSETLSEMMSMAQDVARKEGIDRTGFRLVFNCGADAGQAVDHLHLHCLGKRALAWPPG